MSTCKVKYIEDRLRKTNPQLADELTDKHIQIFDYVSESKAFNKKEGRYFLNKEGTKKRITQEKIINTVNVNFGNVASIKRNNKGDYFSTNLFENNFINNLFENKKEEKASVLLKKIAESDYALKDLAIKLLPLLKTDFKVTLVPLVGNNENYQGEYSELTREIKLKETANNPSRTILHEVIHGLSEMQLKNFSKPEITQHFKELFEYTKNMTNSELYGLKNPSEFLVALFTDVNLINLLKEVPPMDTAKKYANLFEEIFDFILNTLGFTKENSSLYEQAFSTATNILSEQYKYTDTKGDRILNQKEKDYIPILYQNISNLQELYNSEDYLDRAYTKIQSLERTIDYMKESIVFNEQKRFIDQSDVMHYNVLHSSYINSDSKLFPYLQGYQGFVKFLVNDGQFEANANLEYELDLQPITDEEAFSLYNKNLESFKDYIDLKEQEQILDDLKSFKKEKNNIKNLQDQADAFAKSGILFNMDETVLNSVENIKPGVEELFDKNPELASIGTSAQYSTYLDSIFPDSKVKDVFHHWSVGSQISEQFGDDLLRVKGIWLSKNANHWKDIIRNKSKRLGINEIKGHYVIINSKKVWVDSTLESPNKDKFPNGYDTIVAYNEAPNNYSGDVKPEFKTIDDFESVVKSKEQIYTLGTKQDVEGFKKYISNNNSTLFQNQSSEGIIASEKTIRDLAARMSDRIGMPIKFESDRSKEYKGKIENGVAYVNLAYATLDTPIHEVLGHPIIRAIKNSKNNYYDQIKVGNSFNHATTGEYVTITNIDKNGAVTLIDKNGGKEITQAEDYFFSIPENKTTLYTNLLKELESGIGKEVLDRIKRDYVKKEITDYSYLKTNGTSIRYEDYTLEEQQEEAIVELLGLMTADKLDKVKDGKLISLLKRLLKEMKAFMKQLLSQREVDIDKLPDNMTLGDLSDLLAYSNSKLILPGNEVIYTTPDNQTFSTYQEASNHISELAKSVEDVDLDKGISIGNIDKEIETLQKELDNFKFEIEPFNKFIDVYTKKGRLRQNYWARKKDGTTGWTGGTKETLIEPEYDGFVLDIDRGDGRFITKVTDEEAEKIYYDQENKFNITTKESREKYAELETKIHNLENNSLKGFIKINKEYEQSKEIIEEWKKVNNIQYNPEEIYSRGQEFSSVVGAYSSFDVNLMMQNLLQHIEDNEKAGGKFAISAYTKPVDKQIGHLEGGGGKIKFNIYPQSNDILWAANTDVYSGSVWDASLKVNKDKKSELLGVSYTKFPALRNINSVQPNLASVVDDLAHHHNELGIVLTGNNFRLEYDEDIPYQTKKIIDSVNSILDQKYGKLVKPEINNATKEKVTKFQVKGEPNIFNTREEAQALANKLSQIDYMSTYVVTTIQVDKTSGIQPTQTNETLKESIGNVKDKIKEYDISEETYLLDNDDKGIKEAREKRYTSQALINTKIAALKEVAKKYPRSLIRSEVKRINTPSSQEFYNQFEGEDFDLPFQKIPSKEITLNINNQDIEKLSNLPTNIQEYMLSLTKEDLSKVIDTLKEYDNLDYLPDDNTYIDMLKCKI